MSSCRPVRPMFSSRLSQHRRTPGQIRSFNSSGIKHAHYNDTVQNLRIGKHTRVIYQGFTGRVATTNAKDSLAYGTNIVGGVTPNKEGEHLGLPLLPNLRRAKEELKPDATAVFVAAPQCGAAIEQAIEAEIPLIVAVAEHIPLHDMLRVMSILHTQSKSRLVGANAPGIIAPIGSCRIGFQPLPTFAPGHIGIVAKSGTLSYECVASITRSGLGQSLCIGMGGDIVAGTSLVDALKVFEKDPETEGICLIGEVGGYAEVEAAAWIKDYRKREENPKPIAALVGGLQAPDGTVMGHAGAWAEVGERSAAKKYRILEDAGATMVDHPENFGGVMKTLLSQAGKDVGKIQQHAASQRRGFHTMRRRPLSTPSINNPSLQPSNNYQQRNLHLQPSQIQDSLAPYFNQVANLNLTDSKPPKDALFMGITIDRSARTPAITVSPTTSPAQQGQKFTRIPYSWQIGSTEKHIHRALKHLQLDVAPSAVQTQVSDLLNQLASAHKTLEAISLTANVSVAPLTLHLPTLHQHYDPSAYLSAKRQAPLHNQRDTSLLDPDHLEAATHGIVYHRLQPTNPSASIGTLVNGAGLAMNTVDHLTSLNNNTPCCTNFLDTGGKATAETVKKSFQIILKDERVKVIFVNIFGGLTDGGMIAEGVLLAFKEVEMRGVPVIVRIRGTNEEVGQRVIRESGLGLESFDGFGEAAKRVIELSKA